MRRLIVEMSSKALSLSKLDPSPVEKVKLAKVLHFLRLDYEEVAMILRVEFNEPNVSIEDVFRDLQDFYFHTTVTCALYKGIEKVEVLDRRDFNEDIISNIDGAVNFLKQWIPVRDEPTGTHK